MCFDTDKVVPGPTAWSTDEVGDWPHTSTAIILVRVAVVSTTVR